MKHFMKKNWIKFSKDQKGSSMVVVLIAIAFVTVLVSVIMTSSLTMMRMKSVNYNSKGNFYDADAILDEIYAAIGQDCFTSLNDAFIETASGMVSATDHSFATNDVLNEQMKSLYLEKMAADLAKCKTEKINIEHSALENCEKYLAEIVRKFNPAAELSVMGIEYDALNEKIIIKNVTVTAQKGDYKSSVITDLVVKYPLEENISFLKEGDDTDNYLNYALIGLKSVDFRDCTTASSSLATHINGSVFAGDLVLEPLNYVDMKNGILINSSKTFLSTKSVDAAFTTSLQLENVDFWTKNIVLGELNNGYENNSAVFVTKDSNLYVADDLTLEGNNAIASVDGNYYGFMTDTGANGSAVIVNGQNCSLNISYKDLFIGGESIIKETGYQTLDSLGIKGIQELYLVPANYLMGNSNPSDRLEEVEMYTVSTAADGKKTVKNKFYACPWLDIDANDPAKTGYEVIRTATNVYYYYLKFKDEAAELKYLESIMSFNADEKSYSYHDGGALKTVEVTSDATLADLTNLQKILRTCAKKFGTVGVSPKSGSSVLSTRGNLLKILGASLQTVSRGTGSINLLDENHLNAAEHMSNSVNNYYTVMQNYLGYSSTAVLDGIDIYQRSIDVNAISKDNTNVFVPGPTTDQIVAVIRKGNNGSTTSYTIEKSYTKGLVLAYDMDVILDHDFDGLIFTNRNIYIKENGANVINITKNPTLIKNILDDNYPTYRDVAKYFRKFTQEGDELTLNPVRVEDMVQFENWRKNYVSD